MDFTRLPIHFIESVLSHCDFEAIAKMRRTCSMINKIIKKKKFDKMDIKAMAFCKMYEEINEEVIEQFLIHLKCDKLSNKQVFRRSYGLTVEPGVGLKDIIDCFINDKMVQVLSSIKAAESIFFYNLHVDETLMNIIESVPVQWNKVTAEFRDCSYLNPKSILMRLSKVFKYILVNEIDEVFLQNDAKSFDDQFFGQTLLNVVFYNDKLFEAPNITDRTLDSYAEKLPPTLRMQNFITNFTVDGIINFLKYILNARDQSIECWIIGTVRLNRDDFIRIGVQIDNVENWPDYCQIQSLRIEDNRVLVEFAYTKENEEEMAKIAVAMIIPEEFADV